MTEWLAYLALAISLWGREPDMPVVIRLVDGRYDSAMAEAYVGPTCTILIYTTQTDGLSARWRKNLVTHELGHCLGLQHLPDSQPGVMQGYLGQDFGVWDRLLLWRKFGSPHAVGGISLAR